MIRRMLVPCLATVLFVGCAATSQVKRTDPVTILLTNGDKIDAEVVDIHRNKIIFKAHDWKKAYEYGEIINLERVQGIGLRDGQKLSVTEYDAFRKGEDVEGRGELARARTRRSSRGQSAESDENLHYEDLKRKPISEMTDNEFAFFMMMKEKEAQAEARAQGESAKPAEPVNPVEVIVMGPEKPPTAPPMPPAPAPVVAPQLSVGQVELEEVAKSLFEADLAVAMLNHLKGKRNLTASETALLNLIQNNPEWQDKIDDLFFLNRTAHRAMERAFLYTPDELSTRLGLDFDKDLDLDYFNLMAQLHRRLGEDVKVGDFRAMLEIFGESGSRAIREILENYDSWQFVISQDGFVTK